MTDDLEPDVRAFLDSVDSAYEEYENGYADADATLRVLRQHVDDLREAVE